MVGPIGTMRLLAGAGLVFCVLGSWPAQSFAQEVAAFVDQGQVAKGEAVTLTIQVSEGDSSVPKLPQMDDWTAQYAGQQTSVNMINFQVSRSTTYNFILFPQKTGALTIPSIPVRVDTKWLKTNPLHVRVGGSRRQTAGPREQAASDAGEESDDVIVEVDLEPREAYVGQMIRQTLRVYTSIPLGDSIQVGRRAAQDTVEEQLPEALQRRYTTTRNGRRYRVEEAAWVFYPVTSGELEILPMDVSVPIVIHRRRRNTNPLFDDFFSMSSRIQPRRYSTAETFVRVKPVPNAGRHPGYSGLVGRFTINGALSSDKLALGESTTLTVSVKGEGNARDATLQPLDETLFKTYDDTPTVSVQTDARGEILVEKTFKRALVPQRSGELTIPPLEISYFDPVLERFVTVSSEPLTLVVAPGALGETTLTAAGTPLQSLGRRAIEMTGEEDILPIHVGPELSYNRYLPPRSRGVLAAFMLPAFMFGLGTVVRRILLARDADPATRRRRNALKAALAALKRAEHAKERKKGAWLEISSKTVRSYLGDKLDAEGGALTPRDARSLLELEGVEESLAVATERLLEAVEQQRYSPMGTGSSPTSFLKQARELLRKLEKALG